jgi:hypothetical protein
MKTNKNNEASEKPIRENIEVFAGYQDIKVHLLLCFFIALEWITWPWKSKENRCTSGIGLS